MLKEKNWSQRQIDYASDGLCIGAIEANGCKQACEGWALGAAEENEVQNSNSNSGLGWSLG